LLLSRLFDALDEFADLEARIAALPTQRDRGDAFEVFAEGAEEVWPADQVMEHGTFSWHTDLPVPLGGTNEAPSPTALLLSALAGCAVVFIRDTLAPQLGVTVYAIEATAQCETDARGLLGMDSVAPDVRNVGLTIAIQSPEDEDAVRRVYQAWQERCPVYLALTKALTVATSLDIKRP
jgi:uncharacterized OsmC-like protein